VSAAGKDIKVGHACKVGMLLGSGLDGCGPHPRRVLRAMLYGKEPLSTPANWGA